MSKPNRNPDPPVPATGENPGREAANEALLYLGPPLLNPVHLAQRSLFRDGLPAELAGLVERDADLRACFVPVSQAGQALRGQRAEALAKAAARVATTYRRRK